MAFFSREILQNILDSNPVEDVVREYFPLKPDGRNFKALCPFHQEKTPSFKVNPARQYYHCFGCGAHGNSIDFMMAMDRVAFPEAVKALARRAGITLRESPAEAQAAAGRNRLYEVNGLAQEYYQRVLWGPDGRGPLEYILGRGFSEASIRAFGLGFAPVGWDSFYRYARARGAAQEALEAAGLVVRRKTGDGYVDYMRNRIVFPIHDVRRRVVGFGGRTLEGEEPKYLNSPETAVFAKGRTLYGLSLARDGIRKAGRVIIMEGYTDVVMAFQSGVECAVACLGTALSEAAAREIRRYTQRTTLVFDGDEAGRRAAERSVDTLLAQDLEVRVLVLPDRQDPCDYLKGRGGQAFLGLLDSAVDGIDFKLDEAIAAEGCESPMATLRAVERSIRSVEALPNEVARTLLLRKVAERFRVSEQELRRRVRGLRPRAAPAAGEPLERVGVEEWLIEAVLGDPGLAGRAFSEYPLERFENADLRRIAEAVRELSGGAEDPARELLGALAGEPALGRAIKIVERIDVRAEEARRAGRASGEGFRELLERCLAEVRKLELEHRALEVRQLLQDAERDGDREASTVRLREYQELLAQLKR